ncbi:MAG: hypothetical protein KF767_02415 [Bdellovibrionaceae bacterium]|nr:hypothetical protein [Pseudobdellovibrionaceae bacterium]
MTPKQKRIVKLATFALIAIQGLGTLYAVSTLLSIPQYGLEMNYVSIVLGAAVWPVMVGSAAFTSLRFLFQDNHYGWMGLVTVAVVTLPSLCFPASAVLLYVLLSPAVRTSMLKKIDAEWGLSETAETPEKSQGN